MSRDSLAPALRRLPAPQSPETGYTAALGLFSRWRLTNVRVRRQREQADGRTLSTAKRMWFSSMYTMAGMLKRKHEPVVTTVFTAVTAPSHAS
jgi:succinate dehydrogenase/fumarate reductase flavoprotein subunit